MVVQDKVMTTHDKAGHEETQQSTMKQGILAGTSIASTIIIEQGDTKNKDESNSCKIQEDIQA